jgi:hypothetical protein
MLKGILVRITFSNKKHCGMVDIGQWGVEIGRDWEASSPATP